MTFSVAGASEPLLRRVRVEVRWAADGGRGVVAEALVYGGARGRS